LTGEQYELLSPADNDVLSVQRGPLFTIRHVLRSSPSTVKVLGIYYVLEGVIYKSPSVRALMKAIVSRTVQGLSDACDSLSVCARYEPSSGYTWNFDAVGIDNDGEKNEETDEEILRKITGRRKKDEENS